MLLSTILLIHPFTELAPSFIELILEDILIKKRLVADWDEVAEISPLITRRLTSDSAMLYLSPTSKKVWKSNAIKLHDSGSQG